MAASVHAGTPNRDEPATTRRLPHISLPWASAGAAPQRSQAPGASASAAIALASVLLAWNVEASGTPIVPGQRAPFAAACRQGPHSGGGLGRRASPDRLAAYPAALAHCHRQAPLALRVLSGVAAREERQPAKQPGHEQADEADEHKCRGQMLCASSGTPQAGRCRNGRGRRTSSRRSVVLLPERVARTAGISRATQLPACPAGTARNFASPSAYSLRRASESSPFTS